MKLFISVLFQFYLMLCEPLKATFLPPPVDYVIVMVDNVLT